MDIEKLKAHIIRLRQVGGGSTTLSVDDVEFLINEREEAVAKLAAMENQRFNVKEFIRRCQDQWDFDVKIASKMLEIAKHVPTAPADKLAVDWTQINELVTEYIDDYHYAGDGGYYCPTEWEKALITDGIVGLLDELPSKPAARITEQDAREMALSVLLSNGFVNGRDYIDPWLNREGRTLLNKLNADREQVPAVSVPSGYGDRLEKAHMCGQVFAGTDPSFSAAQQYSNEVLSVHSPAPSHSQQSEPTDLIPLDDVQPLISDALTAADLTRNKSLAKRIRNQVSIILDRCPNHESKGEN